MPLIQNRDADFVAWMNMYKRAWETRNPELVGDLFTNDAQYYIKPFDEPLAGRDAIVAYWRGVQRTQRDVRFDYEVLAGMENRGIAHWWVEFSRKSKPVRLDGVMLVELDDDNCCQSFREWWCRG